MNITLDLPRFWAENQASTGHPFRTDKPRAPISLPVDDHWLLEEMEVPSTVRYYREAAYRAAVNRQCNDRCAAAIGRRPFAENVAPPGILRIEEVLGAKTELTEGGTPWLEPAVHTIEELRAHLDRLAALDDRQLRARMFRNGGLIERAQPNPDGSRPVQRGFSRGPATIATSVLGTTELMFWLLDYPAEVGRFFELLADILIRYQQIVAAERGVCFRGYQVNDDNCALYSPALYEQFCLPAMRRIFDTFCPAPTDYRYQHSDSEMTHLLPILARLNFHGVNLGPTLPVEVIRAHLPRTEIHGQVAPFTLRNRPVAEIVAEVRRDFAGAGGDGGLLVTTAGSIAAGTKFEAIRAFMWAVQEYCRYDR